MVNADINYYNRIICIAVELHMTTILHKKNVPIISERFKNLLFLY
jgi:hypothetical protein